MNYFWLVKLKVMSSPFLYPEEESTCLKTKLLQICHFIPQLSHSIFLRHLEKKNHSDGYSLWIKLKVLLNQQYQWKRLCLDSFTFWSLIFLFFWWWVRWEGRGWNLCHYVLQRGSDCLPSRLFLPIWKHTANFARVFSFKLLECMWTLQKLCSSGHCVSHF